MVFDREVEAVLGGAKSEHIGSDGSGCARTLYIASRSIIVAAIGPVTVTV
jgi:hypothetical protein